MAITVGSHFIEMFIHIFIDLSAFSCFYYEVLGDCSAYVAHLVCVPVS